MKVNLNVSTNLFNKQVGRCQRRSRKIPIAWLSKNRLKNPEIRGRAGKMFYQKNVAKKSCCISESVHPNALYILPESRSHKLNKIMQRASKNGYSEVVTTEDNAGSERGAEYENGSFLNGFELPVLLLVPLAWGTWSPATVLLYRELNNYPPPFLLNSYFQFMSFSALFATMLVKRKKVLESDKLDNKFLIQNKELIHAGTELGAYLFIGSSLQLYGLQYTSANKAAFLVQLTTIIVPIIEGIFLGRKLRKLTWAACLLGLIGVGVLSAGDFSSFSSFAMNGIASSNAKEILGDICCAIAALFFSLHVVRLGGFAGRLPPISLASVKAGTQLVLCSISWAVGSYLGFWGGEPLLFSSSTTTYVSWIVIAVILWNGLIPSAFTVWAQSFGQRVVQPTTANMIYTMQPLWATAFATVFLQEIITPMTCLGGSLILIGSLLAVLTSYFQVESVVDDSK